VLAALCLLINLWWVVRWQTATQQEPLQVVYHAPQGIAGVDTQLQIIFNRPMVHAEEMGKEMAKSPVTCYRPEKPGQLLRFRALWESPRMLTLRSMSPLAKASLFEVRVAPQARATDGQELGKPFVFQFMTTPLRLLAMRQYERKKTGTVSCEVKFDDEVLPQQLAANMICTNERGEKLKCEVSGQRASPVHVLHIEARNAKQFTLEVMQGLLGRTGALGLPESVSQNFALNELSLTLHSVETRTPGDGDPYVHLYFSDRVETEQLKAFLRVEPAVPLRIAEEYGYIRVSGPFALGNSYRLHLRQGLTSENGWTLAKDMTQTAAFSDREPLLRLAGTGQILGLDGNLAVALETVNYDNLEVKLHRIYTNNLVHFLKGSHYRWQSMAHDFGWPVAQRQLKIAAERNTLARTVLQLREWLPVQPAGVYLLQIHDDQHEWNSEWRMLFITDLGITSKQAGGEIVVWVTSLARGSEVEDATVSLLTATNQKLAEAVSDVNGLARLAFPQEPIAKDAQPYVVQVNRGGDLAVLKLSSGLWNMSPFATSGFASVSKGYRAFLYTDRGVYRPGETAHIMTLLRDAQRTVPPAFPLSFSVERSDGVVLRNLVVQPAGEGSAEVTWDIPSDIRTGFYTAKVGTVGGKDNLGSVQFQVEEFVPERLKLSLQVPAQIYRLGDQLPVTLSATHLFGAPASSCKAQLKVFLSGKMLDMPQLNGYTVGDESRVMKPFQAFQAEMRLDAEGKASFRVPLSGNLQPPAVLQAEVQGSVQEAGGRAITRTETVTVYPYPVYLGIQSLDAKTIRPGEALRFAIAAVTPAGESLSLPNVEVRVWRHVWTWHRKRDQGNWDYEYVRQEQEICRTALALQDGKGVYTFTPAEYGEYRVCVQDTQGGMASAIVFNTWGGDDMQAGGQEYVRLQLAKTTYQAGDVAEIHLRAPFDGKALVTLEREQTFVSQVVEVKNRTATVSFVVKPEYLPNVYCAATVLRAATPVLPGPRRAYGFLSLPFAMPERKLDVAIEAPGECLPEHSVEVSLAVSNNGTPVSDAEVTLAAVDEGICQVTRFTTPDPFAFFYGKEALLVRSGDMFSQLLPEEPAGEKSSEQRPARERSKPVNGKRFRTVALWHTGLRSDSEGKVRVTLNVPRYLGELRLMAVAWRGPQFGKKEASLKVRKPVMLEVSAPRFAAWGDEFVVTASIFNQSGVAQSARLTMRASTGAEVVGEDTLTQEVAQGGDAVFLFRVRCQGNSDHTVLELSGRAGNEALREEIYLPLRPARPAEEKHGCGTLSLGTRDTLSIPHAWREQSGSIELKLSPRPNLQLARSLDYLLRYPYGCIEQTTATSFPLLYVADLLDMVQQKSGKQKSVVSYIEAGINRLSLMQTPSGGLGWWPGDETPYPWGTVYAGHFLCEAKNAGYPVPAHLLEGIARYLKCRVQDTEATQEKQEVVAYAYYLLASLGKVTASQVAYLENDMEKRSSLEKCLLAATFHVLGRKAAADKILESRLTFDGKQETGGNLHSPVRNKAIYLSTLIDAKAESPYIALIVPDLMAYVQQSPWYTTQEAAYTLMALGKYAAQFRHSENVTLSGEISVPGSLPFSFTGEREVQWKISQSAATTLQVNTSGQGNVFFYWVSKGMPQEQKMQELTQGMRIARVLYDEQGNSLPAAYFVKQGELVWVELTIEGEQAYQNIAVENWLPSGFEAENPRLSQASDATWFSSDGVLQPEYVDVRDDRLAMFINLPDSHAHKLYFALRAVSPGRFYLPGVQAYCMYQPFLRAQSTSAWLEIK
jgi:uncharacterized protein YfaS (alpha-2-macroglobulin family)